MALVHRYVVVSAGAVLIPIPIVDTVALAAVHVELIRQITQYYGKEFSEHAARNLLIAIGTSLVPASLGSVVSRRVIRALPLMTHGLAFAAMSAFSAFVSYALGTLFVEHYESGGTLHTFDVNRLHRVFSRRKAPAALAS
jgi:uncharacterized protein (DUF697 family)